MAALTLNAERKGHLRMKAGTKASIAGAVLALAVMPAPRPASGQQAMCWTIATPDDRFRTILLNQCTGETWILGEARAPDGRSLAMPQWNRLPRTDQREGRHGTLTLQDLVRLADQERVRLWFATRFPGLRPGDPWPASPPDSNELRRLYPGERD